MKHKPSDEQLNLITWVPESHQWGSESYALYHSPKTRRWKLFFVCLMIGVGFSLHSPMTSYTAQSYTTVASGNHV